MLYITGAKLKHEDFELMIIILKLRSNTDWNKDYIDNLDVIETIRREIIQSSSGILDQTNFHDMIDRMSKVRYRYCSGHYNISIKDTHNVLV